MQSNYTDIGKNTGTLGSKHPVAYRESSETKVNKVCRSYYAAVLLTFATLGSTNSDVRHINTQVQTTSFVQKAVTYEIASAPIEETNIKESSLITESNKLQKEFGFKTAQWATVLQVQRKTLYNWAKNPKTNVQEKVAARIGIFDRLFKEMDEGHAQYLASFAFGRYLDTDMAKVIIDEQLSFEQLVEQYERLYSEFDGKHKRNKHKYSLYS